VASESDVIGWTAEAEGLLLVAIDEACEVRESMLGRVDLGSRTDAGGLPSVGLLLSETPLELEGEGERVGDCSLERPRDLDLVSLSRLRRKKPVKRPSLRESANECMSTLLDLGE